MELAFKVRQNSDYYQHIKDYIEFAKQEHKFVRLFVESHQGLVCDNYVVRAMGRTNTPITKENVSGLEFGIEVDEDKLDDDVLAQFKKPNKNNVRYLKKNSKLMKEFRNLAVESGLVTNVNMLSPIDFYDKCYIGRYSWNRFLMSNGELYVKLNVNRTHYSFDHSDFEPIKLSKYYQKLEEYRETM